MNDMILETKRLKLRYQRHSDIETLVNIWANTEVTKYIGQPRKRDFLLNEFKKSAEIPKAEKYDLWVVIEKESEKVIGHCGYIDKQIEGNIEIDLTYIFSPDVWGKGYATEIAQALKNYAFNDIGINRLIALIHPENIASANVARKIGMKIEKQIVRPNNEVRDLFVIENQE